MPKGHTPSTVCFFHEEDEVEDELGGTMKANGTNNGDCTENIFGGDCPGRDMRKSVRRLCVCACVE